MLCAFSQKVVGVVSYKLKLPEYTQFSYISISQFTTEVTIGNYKAEPTLTDELEV